MKRLLLSVQGMKRLLLSVLVAALIAAPAAAQTLGPPPSSGGTPGGSSGQVQYNNAGVFGGYTTSGDCTLVASTGVVTCLKTNGSSFGPSATNASVTGTGAVVNATSPTLVTPALGTPSSGVATNLTGTASGLTAGNVTTNANLTGPITSSGNATAVAAQTGTGSTFAMQASPSLVTPTLGVAAATSLALGNTLVAGDQLDVYNNTAGANIAEVGDGFLAIQREEQYTADATGPTYSFRKSRGSFGTPAAVVSADALGTLNFAAYDGGQFRGIASILGSVSTYTTLNNLSSSLVFRTRPDGVAAAITTALTLDKNQVATFAANVAAPTFNGDTFTTGTYTLTGAAAKTLTFNNSLTLAGTDGQTETFPSTSASIARTDAAQTFTGVQTFNTPIAVGSGGSGVANTGNLTWNAAQTFSFTSGQTMTFPATTATIARTDAAQTFTGSQTLSSALIYGGVTLSNSVTGTGSMALSASPAFTGTVTAVALTTTGAVSVGNASNLLWTGRGILTSPAAATIQVGAADGASPPAELFEFQSVVAGTSNTAGVNSTIQASRGTGTGVGGDIIFKAAPAGTTGTAQNAVVTAFTISNKGIPVLPSFTVATLPASPPAGSLAMVTDQLTACPANLVAPTGGGAVICPVVYTTAWLGL